MRNTEVMNVEAKPSRIISLDQFRGYTVVGMFVVNFLGGLAITHQVLKHNNTHFSYADSIMPSFILVCGFSYRMSYIKRLAEVGAKQTAQRFLSRSLSLMLLSLMLYGFNDRFSSWSEMTSHNVTKFVAELIKANLWEVLAIIGALQILILPVVGSRSRVRVVTLVFCAVMHVLISWSFNYEFVYGRANWMDGFFGAAGKRAWDGGFFGLISWAEAMLAGTLAFDLMERHRPLGAAARLFGWGLLLMLLGYGLSCFTRLYDVGNSQESAALARAASPVFPPLSNAAGRSWSSLLAEPPFVAPPPPEQRRHNYWMMDKRVVTQSFMLFSIGFALAVYGIFVIGCDIWRIEFGPFRTFGQNPLAAYMIHHFVAISLLSIVPKDAPLGLVVSGLVCFLGITYFFVRFLEKRSLYLRL